MDKLLAKEKDYTLITDKSKCGKYIYKLVNNNVWERTHDGKVSLLKNNVLGGYIEMYPYEVQTFSSVKKYYPHEAGEKDKGLYYDCLTWKGFTDLDDAFQFLKNLVERQ